MTNRPNAKGRKGNHTFLRLIHPMLDHPNFHSLSPRAVKLLIDIAAQYRGNNNGDLCATYSVMKERGWTSNDQIQKGLRELLATGWLMLTRQGRRPKIPNLYAISWEPINECGGKLEVTPTKTAPNTWKRTGNDSTTFRFSDHRHTVQATPPHGAMEGENVVPLNRHSVPIGQKS